MALNDDKFSPEETYNKINPIGKIIASVCFGLLGGVLLALVFAQYRNIMVCSLILLAIGFIMISIWNKNFYIYRYMLPAILILLVFTAYPIGYTIYIAFTNFGTGHMQTKDETKSILLNTKWTVDYNSRPLYAEFYAPQKEIKEYMDAYIDAFKKFDYNMDKLKQKGKSEEFIQASWDNDFYGVKQPELIKSYLGKLEKDDFTVIFYTERSIDSEIEPEVLDTLKVYVSDKGNFDLREIDLSNVESLTKGKILIGSTVYERDTLDVAEKEIERVNADDDEEYVMVSVEDFKDYYVSVKDKNPFKIDSSEYLLDNANQLFSKRHSYKISDPKEPNQIYYLNGDTFEYDRKVFEDNRQGVYVLTKDEKAPAYWNEYVLEETKYDYGALTLEKSSDAEKYLDDKIKSLDLKAKFVFTNKDLVEGKKIGEVSKTDLDALKKEIAAANKLIADFNKNIGKYKQDFMALEREKIKNEYPELPGSFSKTVFEKNILNKVKREEQRNLLLYCYRVSLSDESNYVLEEDKAGDEMKKDIWEILSGTGYFDLKKEKNKKTSQLNATKFPKLSPFKLQKIVNANVDRSVPIEPGYSVWVGMNNFKKIVTSRNITAPFLYVFMWTIVWSAFSVISSFAMGLALALVFNASDFKGKYIYRTLFILPYAIPAFVSVLMWNGFLNKDFGVINNLLKTTFHVAENIPWTMDGTLAKISCLVVNLWLSFPYFMIISLGALQSIDSSMYEAADVDGATPIQQFLSITLPLLLIALGPMLVGSFAFAFNNFGGIYLLTGGGPTMAAGVLPGHTDILISYTYKLAFGPQDKDYGLASSIAIIVFLIIGTITFLNFKFTGTFKEVDNA